MDLPQHLGFSKQLDDSTIRLTNDVIDLIDQSLSSMLIACIRRCGCSLDASINSSRNSSQRGITV